MGFYCEITTLDENFGLSQALWRGVETRVYTADHGGYKFIAYVLTILPHILSLRNNSWCLQTLNMRKDMLRICDELIATVVCRDNQLLSGTGLQFRLRVGCPCCKGMRTAWDILPRRVLNSEAIACRNDRTYRSGGYDCRLCTEQLKQIR